MDPNAWHATRIVNFVMLDHDAFSEYTVQNQKISPRNHAVPCVKEAMTLFLN